MKCNKCGGIMNFIHCWNNVDISYNIFACEECHELEAIMKPKIHIKARVPKAYTGFLHDPTLVWRAFYHNTETICATIIDPIINIPAQLLMSPSPYVLSIPQYNYFCKFKHSNGEFRPDFLMATLIADIIVNDIIMTIGL